VYRCETSSQHSSEPQTSRRAVERAVVDDVMTPRCCRHRTIIPPYDHIAAADCAFASAELKKGEPAIYDRTDHVLSTLGVRRAFLCVSIRCSRESLMSGNIRVPGSHRMDNLLEVHSQYQPHTMLLTVQRGNWNRPR
jgi:hypothetical protein